MKVCVIGGSGFIGVNLCVRLLGAGYKISVLDQRINTDLQAIDVKGKIDWFVGDFSDKGLLCQSLSECEILFHLASITIPGSANDDPIFDIEKNLIASINLIKVANEMGVAHIIYASSGGTVYGIPDYVPLDENHATNPICSYGINKLAIEKYLKLSSYTGGASHTIFRLSNPYGKFQNPNSAQGVIPVFMKKMLSGEKITIWGDGEVVRDFIYIDDVIDVFIKSISKVGENRVYNLGSGTGQSINDILSAISNLCVTDSTVEYVSSRLIDVPVNVLDVSALVETYDWHPMVSLEEGLMRTLDCIKSA